MTIANKLKAALASLPTGSYKTSEIVQAVIASNPTLNAKSVSRTLAKQYADIVGLDRTSVGVYSWTNTSFVKTKKSTAIKPSKKSKSFKTPVAKAAEAARVAAKTVGKTHVGISRDHSASMRSLSEAARKDYNQLLSNVQEGNKISESTLTTVICGDHSCRASVSGRTSSVLSAKPLTVYDTPGGSTPLFDSIGLLINELKTINAGPNDAFLVMIITDGAENSSKQWNQQSIVNEIRALQSTDKWTFVFRVPKGQRRTIESWGIDAGNIQEWETTTRGMEAASSQVAASMTSYYADTRATGQTRTAKFFTDASAVTDKTLQRSLVDVSSEVKLLTVGPADNNVIRPFIKDKLGIELKNGSAFYQLIKTETVQPQKDILIRVKKNGAVYHGAAARDLIGLPHAGNIRVAPGNHGDYDIYVQSTSVNRVLPVGSLVAYWDVHSSAFKSTL